MRKQGRELRGQHLTHRSRNHTLRLTSRSRAQPKRITSMQLVTKMLFCYAPLLRGSHPGATRAGTRTQRLVRRARIVLLAAAGHPNPVIGAHVQVSVDTVRKWRGRWCAHPDDQPR